MHSDLYKGYYHTPDEFLTDVLRIQANAEVNKIMEQDAEAPIKAGQMVNHTKVMLDQTFDTHFRSECANMAARMKEKDKNQPRKERKGRGRPLPTEGIVAAAKQAAIDGGLYKVRPPQERPTEEGAGEDEVVVVEESGENGLKRPREDGQDEQATDDVGHEQGRGPAKRQRADDDSIEHEPAVPGAVDSLQDASSSLVSTNGVHAGQDNGANSNLNELLNPTSPAALATFPPPHLAQSAVPAVAIPMAVGATPSLSPLKRPEPNFLAGAPIAASANPFLSASSEVPPPPNGAAAAVAPSGDDAADVLREATPTPAAIDAATPPRERSPTPMIEATPPPLPDFVVPTDAVERFAAFLANDTAHLNVDQLEQLRAALFDVVWRGKGDWDRSRLLGELNELAADFVEEVEMLSSSST